MTAPGRSRSDLPLLAVVGLAIALRLPHLVDRSVWYDEASSWQTASFDLPNLFLGVRRNVHMPLYYLLLKLWFAAFGDSVVALRGFSIAFGVATVVLADRMGRSVYLASKLRDESDWDPAAEARNARRFGLSVALLTACSPFMVLASIEARMYTLGSTLAVLAGWEVVGLLRSKGRGKLWWPFGSTCLALAYTHHYGLLTVASAFLLLFGAGMMALGRGSREEGRRLLVRGSLTAVVVGLLYLPGLEILRGQVGRVRQEYWIGLLDGATIGRTFAEFALPIPDDWAPRPIGWAVLGLFAAACAVVAWRPRTGEVVALGLALGPIAASAALSLWTPVWVPRYFRIAYPAMLAVVVLAVFARTIRRPRARSAIVVGLAVGLGLANLPFWGAMDLATNTGPRTVAERILERSEPGELIVVQDLHQYFVLKYDLRRRGRALRLLKPAFEPFWGPHLIREGDLITTEALRSHSGRTLWVAGNTPSPIGLDLPDGFEPLERVDATSHLHLHRHLFATRFGVNPSQESGR